MIKLTDLLLEAQLPSSEQDMDIYAKKYKKTIDYYVDITLSNDLVNINGKQ